MKIQNNLGSFEEDVECHKNSDCKDKNVNNCQNGFCMCGDHHPCSSRTDTCISGANGGGIHDATCKCGEIDECLWDEICQDGKCLAIETEETSTMSSIEDSIETQNPGSIEGSGCK